ncbi:hypothetical protein BT96DRAFT_781096, partial [Gymnopus androsaceus JB14]
TNCRSPYKCYGKAAQLLNNLPEKWNPLVKQPEDSEPDSLDASALENGEVFDWRLTTKGTLADAFRIFTEGEKSTAVP